MKKNFFFKVKFATTLLLSVMMLSVYAQNITVQGTVTDRTKETVIGATIIVMGDPTKGTITDIDGNYTLPNVPSNAKLQFSYVGMTTQVVSVNGRTTIDVVLEDDSEMLSEVVVTALGITKQARSVGYATSKVSTVILSVSKFKSILFPSRIKFLPLGFIISATCVVS